MTRPLRPRAAPPSGAALLALWNRLRGTAGGRRLFGWLLGRIVPYTGTIRPRIRALERGLAVVDMADRRRVRNHLGSVHAIALMNLGEVASGLALLTALPDDWRGIVTGLSIEYTKKARGRLTASASAAAPVPEAGTDHAREMAVEAVIRDEAGDVVARAIAHWRVGPREAPGSWRAATPAAT